MSDPVEIELVNINSITSSGAKFWGRVKVLEDFLEPDENGYIYNEGTHEDEWVAGYSAGTGSQSKEDDYMYLYAKREPADAERTYVTDKKVDLTNWDTLKVEWENTGDESDGNQSHIVVSTNKTASHGTSNASYNTTTDFTKRTNSVEISGLLDEYYIRVHAGAVIFNNVESEIKVHKIWLEKDE